MLKGVNRQIVDIPQPESAFFERAIFFIKPEYVNVTESRLRAKADEMVKAVCDPPKAHGRIKNRKVAKILHLAASAASGAAITLIAQYFIG